MAGRGWQGMGQRKGGGRKSELGRLEPSQCVGWTDAKGLGCIGLAQYML